MVRRRHQARKNRPVTMRPQAPELAWKDESPVAAPVELTASTEQTTPSVVDEAPVSQTAPEPPTTVREWVRDIAPETARTPVVETSASQVDDEVDDLAMAFFESAGRASQPSVPPVLIDDEIRPRVVTVPLSAEAKRRQASLRRMVSIVVGFAALCTLALVVKNLATPSRSTSRYAEPGPDLLQIVAPAHLLGAASPAVVADPASGAETKPDQVTPPAAPAVVAPVEAASAVSGENNDAPAKQDANVPDPAKAKALSKQALALLEAGNFKGAIEKSMASVEADPSDAGPYMYWGTALMELGRRPESKEVFAKCVETATRGAKHECRQFK